MASLLVLGLAVVLGLWLGGRYIYVTPQASGLRAAACVHGGVGAAGVVMLAVAVRGGPSVHAMRAGVGGFGRMALVMLAAALGLGLVFLGLRVARRVPPVLVLVLHGGLAIAGVVLLLAYAGLQE